VTVAIGVCTVAFETVTPLGVAEAAGVLTVAIGVCTEPLETDTPPGDAEADGVATVATGVSTVAGDAETVCVDAETVGVATVATGVSTVAGDAETVCVDAETVGVATVATGVSTVAGEADTVCVDAETVGVATVATGVCTVPLETDTPVGDADTVGTETVAIGVVTGALVVATGAAVDVASLDVEGVSSALVTLDTTDSGFVAPRLLPAATPDAARIAVAMIVAAVRRRRTFLRSAHVADRSTSCDASPEGEASQAFASVTGDTDDFLSGTSAAKPSGGCWCASCDATTTTDRHHRNRAG